MFSSDDLDLGRTVRGLGPGQELFGRYTLDRILGRGGMGIVWLARDKKLDRDVALKFMPELVVHDAGVLDQMKRETRRSLELTHHHIVRIFDFIDDGQIACISMEYVDGPTLSALRVQRPSKVFEVQEMSGWMGQTCEALDYAHHTARIVHRDLKPANLMLNRVGDLKIADFGIARSLSDSVSLITRSQGTSGTLVYMSPQQLDGERASHLDDIYSVGALIYDLLTGKPPFFSGQVDRQIREKLPLTMKERRAELGVQDTQPIPPEWENAVATCLSKNPAQRPQSAGEIAARLGLKASNSALKRTARPVAQDDVPTQIVAPASSSDLQPPSVPKPPSTTRKSVIVAICAVAFLMGCLGTLLVFQRGATDSDIAATPLPSVAPAIIPFATVTPALSAAPPSQLATPPSSLVQTSTASPGPPSAEQASDEFTALTPVGAVRLYFAAINQRDLSGAYGLCSEEFHQRTSLQQYRKIFADTLRVDVSEISSRQNGDSAKVTVRFRVLNGNDQAIDWAGDIDVQWEHGRWRIDRLTGLSASQPAVDPTATPSTQTWPDSDQHLTKFTNQKYRYSALVPVSVFPYPPAQPNDEHWTFSSADGTTQLRLTVENTGRRLSDAYREWSAERTKEHPKRSVQYKIIKSTWFVVSGDDGGRGFYLKCVARDQKLFFLLLDYDEENCPIWKDTFTAMSRSFNGSIFP